MPTLEALQRTINSTESLQSVVKTMKALAAVSIRQYEHAVAALAEYTQTIELGLQIVLRDPPLTLDATSAPDGQLGAIIFGSDYGMVGQFNEQIATYAAEAINAARRPAAQRHILAVGERVSARLADAGMPVEQIFNVPSSVGGITPLVQDLLVQIEGWREQHGVQHLVLCYNQTHSGAIYRPTQLQILPLDPRWLGELAQRPWQSRRLPTYTADWSTLFAALIRQYFFVALYRACAESLANENASRLAAMQRAEQNIEDHLAELTMLFHQLRQSAITEEILDIVAGVEALSETHSP